MRMTPATKNRPWQIIRKRPHNSGFFLLRSFFADPLLQLFCGFFAGLFTESFFTKPLFSSLFQVIFSDSFFRSFFSDHFLDRFSDHFSVYACPGVFQPFDALPDLLLRQSSEAQKNRAAVGSRFHHAF